MTLKQRITTFFFLLLPAAGGTLPGMDVEFPLLQSMSYFPYAHHNTLDKKEFRLTLDMYYSNIYVFDFERTTINDMEMLSTTLGFRYGLSKRLTAELYYRVASVLGGGLDKLIIDFHDLFNLSEGGRGDFPRNRVNYSFKDAFSYSAGTTGQSPLILGLLGHIYENGHFRLNGRLSFGLPLSSKPGFSSNKPFATAGIILLYENKTKRLAASWATHLSLFSTPKWLETEDLKKQMIHSEIRVDYKHLFAGVLMRGTPFREADLSNPAYQVYLGIRIGKRFEFSFIEEFPPMDTMPDVSFNLRIRLR
ncbi:MAG: DUF3187 family protein [bacterium]|nr:DUF3187 family protein [bacterium]